ncbi:MAG: hypothetical protein ACYTEQ_05185 [Planctomycetota bacterium]|jgi:hypothetical protein
MSTPNMGVELLLRPQWNFEYDYDGFPGRTPVFFTFPTTPTRPPLKTADLSVLDDEARVTPPSSGVSPVLAKFVPVPPGATMLFMFPIIVKGPSGTANEPPFWSYIYRIIWRWRSAGDWIGKDKSRKQYLIGKTSTGTADTRTDQVINRSIQTGGSRLLVPCGTEAVVYGKTEPFMPAFVASPFYSMLVQDAVAIPAAANSVVPGSALYPGLKSVFPAPGYTYGMDYQQGVLDPAWYNFSPSGVGQFGTNPVTATHLFKWIKACGTEFAVECFKMKYTDPAAPQTYEEVPWDFDLSPEGVPQSTGQDFEFSRVYGIANLADDAIVPSDTGIRVTVGVAPA